MSGLMMNKLKFVPLVTYKGLGIEDIKNLVNSRDLYIWGCSFLGKLLKRLFLKNELNVKGFCDSNPDLQGKLFDSIPVFSPERIINLTRERRGFLLIAISGQSQAIEKICLKEGLEKNNDFISYIQISRPETMISISSRCNIDCLNCPRNHTLVSINHDFMSTYDYVKVIDKLVKEIPTIFLITLAGYGEPLMHPDIGHIIETTEKQVPCSVWTNLLIDEKIEEVVASKPSQIVIKVSGHGNNYELYHRGAKWHDFQRNLFKLSELVNKIKSPTQINVLFHRYSDNQKDDMQKIKSLASKLGFRFNTTISHICPYDRIFKFLKNKNGHILNQEIVDRLAWDFSKVIDLCQVDTPNPCLCQRIFPVINHDLSVSICHVFYEPIIAKNFLDMPLTQLIERRHEDLHCRECQLFGLHRLDVEVLMRRYPDKKILKTDDL